MVNTDTVNARAACVFHAHFCEFFLFFARFLHSKSTVKYSRIFDINRNKRLVLGSAFTQIEITAQYQ